MELLKDNEILTACWDKGFYVIQEPQGKGWSKKPFPVKLVMDLQGQKKRGEETYNQNSSKLEDKIIEIYRYIYKRFIY